MQPGHAVDDVTKFESFAAVQKSNANPFLTSILVIVRSFLQFLGLDIVIIAIPADVVPHP